MQGWEDCESIKLQLCQDVKQDRREWRVNLSWDDDLSKGHPLPVHLQHIPEWIANHHLRISSEHSGTLISEKC